MITRNLTSYDVQRLMGSGASRREALAMLAILQSCEETYPDTEIIPDEVWTQMVEGAVDRAR